MSTNDRASHFYRKGFRDAQNNVAACTGLPCGSFAYHDYHDGYAAGFNEQYWDAVRENESRK